MFTTIAPPIPEAEPPPRDDGNVQERFDLVTLKRLIWLYFWLLIFEGALRKWILPSWSNPLLIVRDPVVVLIYIFAGVAGVFPRNAFMPWILGLAGMSFVISEIGGDGNLLVTLFGLRTNFLHLPLIFLVPNVFAEKDMDRMARWFMITAFPMCLLVLAQFRASPDSWLNVGAGGGQGGQLESSFGKIRPPGTFSFTAGLVAYLSVTAAFAMHTLMQNRATNRKLASAVLPALAIMIGVSGSRSALGSVTLLLLSVTFVCVKKPAFFGRGIKMIVIIGAAYFALSEWSEFKQGIEVHQSRIEGGGGFRDGMLLRVVGELVEPLAAVGDARFFGVGLGMGTNAVSGLLYGKITFNLGEGDWGRVIRESGPILGLIFIGLRMAILVYLGRRAFAAVERDNPLPLLMFSTALPQVLNGQLGVPMILGWAVLSGALCLAANNFHIVDTALPVPAETPTVPAAVARNSRGRSVYADQLHGEVEDPDIARFGP